MEIHRVDDKGAEMVSAYFHASKYGNGVKVAEEFKRVMASKGIDVTVRPMREAKATAMPAADLYVFSSPGRLGKPRWGVGRFLKKVALPAGTKYAVLTTEMPTPEERSQWRKIIPTMDGILQEKGLVKVAEGTVAVTGIKGPLEDGWEQKVQAFAERCSEEMG